MRESPLFARLHDLLQWLLQHAVKFPRNQRFLLAQRVVQQAFALEDALVAASTCGHLITEKLAEADAALVGLRRTLLLCHELGHLSPGQYRHVSQLVAEVGRLLGGWKKSSSIE